MKNNQRSIIFKSPVNVVSGYSKIIDLFIRNFIKKNVDLYLATELENSKYSHLIKTITRSVMNNSSEFVVCPLSTSNSNKNHLLNPNLNNIKYIFTMWESTNLEYGTSEKVNHNNNVILTPSDWNRKNFIDNGIKCPIYLIPLGVDPNHFYYKPPHNNSKFVFGCGEGQSQLRKRLEYTIECFCRSFPSHIKDVELHVKIDPKKYDDFPRYTDKRIKVFFNHLPENEMISFYENIDVFVSLAYSEGWGLMQHESMMVGRPVMSINYGGITEFFNPEVGIELEYQEELAKGMYLSTNGFWASAKKEDIIEKFRYCYNNQSVIRNKGLLSYDKVKLLTEENTMNAIFEVFDLQDNTI